MKFISFYLPQYHAIPENDTWWGKGFTDWVNVRKAVPRFAGHYQPHVPAKLNYYDLRDPRIIESQADLARSCGIDAFCFYHYWFNGRRLLHGPVDSLLSSGRPDFPFCFCWANENWTRAWDGSAREILIGQNHTPEDNESHIAWLLSAFADPRYLRIDGKPLFLIYRPDAIPDVEYLLTTWRNRATQRGLPGLYLCSVRSSFPQRDDRRLIEAGFDAIVDFQPNHQDMPDPPPPLGKKLKRVFFSLLAKHGSNRFLRESLYYSSNIMNYKDLVRRVSGTYATRTGRIPCVFPSWDNSSRKTRAHIIQNLEPGLFGSWLQAAARQVAESQPAGRQLVFINAWNEWAEGCHLEPDVRMGRAFLDEVLRVKRLFGLNV